MDALTADRIQFAFTVVFHHLFPQLTMGLALLIPILKTIALRTANEEYSQAAHFWTRIFAINFAMGVVTFGWMTAELGRQPSLIYGLMRTAQGISPRVSGGYALFTLIGFFGMYGVLSLLFLFLIYFEVQRGPIAHAQGPAAPVQPAAAR